MPFYDINITEIEKEIFVKEPPILQKGSGLQSSQVELFASVADDAHDN